MKDTFKVEKNPLGGYCVYSSYWHTNYSFNSLKVAEKEVIKINEFYNQKTA